MNFSNKFMFCGYLQRLLNFETQFCASLPFAPLTQAQFAIPLLRHRLGPTGALNEYFNYILIRRLPVVLEESICVVLFFSSEVNTHCSAGYPIFQCALKHSKMVKYLFFFSVANINTCICIIHFFVVVFVQLKKMSETYMHQKKTPQKTANDTNTEYMYGE